MLAKPSKKPTRYALIAAIDVLTPMYSFILTCLQQTAVRAEGLSPEILRAFVSVHDTNDPPRYELAALFTAFSQSAPYTHLASLRLV